ncbi:MAG: end-binding protein Ku [Paraburkholderia sp.]|jgi:non-homologous end joining protein Ku|nr:end-binding protein Ku [Paraburkholderia sp.]
MAARSIASLSLSFGLVSIPVKLYSATQSASDVRFSMLAPDGSRVKQQYVAESTGEVVERSAMKRVTNLRRTDSSYSQQTNSRLLKKAQAMLSR